MRNIFTIGEALEYLAAQTGEKLTESDLFDGFAMCGFNMHAVAPKDSAVVILDTQESNFAEDNPFKPFALKSRLPPGQVLFALLCPRQVAEIWLRGEVETGLPVGFDRWEDERWFFEHPVIVTMDSVRVVREELDRFIGIRARLPELPSRQVSAVLPSDVNPADPASKRKNPPEKWGKGLKRIAWEAADLLMRDNGKISGPALWEAMAKNSGVKHTNGTLRYQKADASLQSGETEVKASTVKKDWCGQLKRLFSASA